MVTAGAHCYTELAVFFIAVDVTTASTHFAYPRKDGQAELSWLAWLNTKTAYTRERSLISVLSRHRLDVK